MKKYYLAAIRGKLDPVLQPLPTQYKDYHKAFDDAMNVLRDTENVDSVIIYSNEGTVVNLKKSSCIKRKQIKPTTT